MAFPRGILAVGLNAFSGQNIAVIAPRYQFVVMHSPGEEPDLTYRNSWRAANSTSNTYAYQNWGFGADNASWTTAGFTTAQARALGYVATYNGAEAVPAGYQIRGLDAGKAGFGAAWANNTLARMGANPGWQGMFFDDVQAADGRLPRDGVPDGYATDGIAYKTAMKAQLQIATDAVRAAGYLVMHNVGGITDSWHAPYVQNPDLVGVADWALMEFAGTWAGATTQFDPASGDKDFAQQAVRSAAALAASRSHGFVVSTFGSTQALSEFNDYWAQIVTEPSFGAVCMSFNNSYQGPWPWFQPPMGINRGNAQGSPAHVNESAIWSRGFSDGSTLEVNTQLLTGTITDPAGGAAVDVGQAIETNAAQQLAQPLVPTVRSLRSLNRNHVRLVRR